MPCGVVQAGAQAATPPFQEGPTIIRPNDPKQPGLFALIGGVLGAGLAYFTEGGTRQSKVRKAIRGFAFGAGMGFTGWTVWSGIASGRMNYQGPQGVALVAGIAAIASGYLFLG